MDQGSDRSKTDTCAKRTLSSVVRTGTLLMGAVLASVLMVDLPAPAGLAAGGEGAIQPYVPASETWIELGAPARSRASLPELQSEFLRKASAVDPAAVPSPRNEEHRAMRRKPRSVPS